MSLDLHGYTVAEALDLFTREYNGRVDRGDLSSFQVVHGYGSGGTGGKIRTALRRILASFEDALQYRTDPVNPGVTIVIPLGRLLKGREYYPPFFWSSVPQVRRNRRFWENSGSTANWA